TAGRTVDDRVGSANRARRLRPARTRSPDRTGARPHGCAASRSQEGAMTAILTTILWWAYMAALVYLLTVAAMFFLMAASAAIEGRIRARQSRNEDFDTLRESPFTIPVSIIAPAYNEAVCIVP